MADPALIARLVEALQHAQRHLLTYNCAVSEALQNEDRLPAELRPLFWEANNEAVLARVQAALIEAAAAGYTGAQTRESPAKAARRPRLVVDNDP